MKRTAPEVSAVVVETHARSRLVIKGSVPGKKNTTVFIKDAIKVKR